MVFAASMELAKGISDLVVAIACIPAARYVAKRPASASAEQLKTKWKLVFILLGIASLMGFFMHSFVIPDIPLRILWVVLYLVMYAAAFCMDSTVTDMYRHTGSNTPYPIVGSVAVAGVFFLLTAGIRLFTGKNTILIFGIYACLIVAHIVLMAVRALSQQTRIPASATHRATRANGPFAKLLIAFIPLVIALLCQILFGETGVFKHFIIDGAVLAHIFILISLVFMVRTAVSSLHV